MTIPISGVRALDHAADVGLELEAPDLPGLLRGGILGMGWLLTEGTSEAPKEDRGMLPGATERELDMAAPDAPALLREVLREVLHWHEDDGVVPLEVRSVSGGGAPRTEGGRVGARLLVTLAPGPDAPAREIKGITLHALAAAPRPEGGWTGRVVFDV